MSIISQFPANEEPINKRHISLFRLNPRASVNTWLPSAWPAWRAGTHTSAADTASSLGRDPISFSEQCIRTTFSPLCHVALSAWRWEIPQWRKLVKAKSFSMMLHDEANCNSSNLCRVFAYFFHLPHVEVSSFNCWHYEFPFSATAAVSSWSTQTSASTSSPTTPRTCPVRAVATRTLTSSRISHASFVANTKPLCRTCRTVGELYALRESIPPNQEWEQERSYTFLGLIINRGASTSS